jgi:hypothetical protein
LYPHASPHLLKHTLTHTRTHTHTHTHSQAASVDLGPIKSISDSSFSPGPIYSPMENLRASADVAVAEKTTPTEITVGESEVTSDVTMEFAFCN